MNRTEVEATLKRDGVVTLPFSESRLIWTNPRLFKEWAKEFGVARYKMEGQTLTIQHKTAFNPDCQRGGPTDTVCVPGEVRMLLNLDGQSYQWLCERCFENEVNFRKQGGFYKGQLWVGPQWKDAKPKPEIQRVILN